MCIYYNALYIVKLYNLALNKQHSIRRLHSYNAKFLVKSNYWAKPYQLLSIISIKRVEISTPNYQVVFLEVIKRVTTY